MEYKMENIIVGKAFVLGDNIDTDQIIPAEHLVYSMDDENEAKMYGKFALSSVPKEQSGLPSGNIPFVSENKFESDYTIIIGVQILDVVLQESTHHMHL